MKSSIRMPLAALTAALVATVAGCTAAADGDKAPGRPQAAAVDKAVRRTEAVGSLRYRITGRVPGQRLGIEGATGAKPATGRIRITYLGSPDADTAVELRLVDGHLYESMSEHGVPQKTHGKHWADFGSTTDVRSYGGLKMDMSGMRDQATQNPAREAAFLTAAENIRRTGTETVGKTRTTHYTGTVTVHDLRSRLKGLGGPGRAGRKRSLDMYAQMGVDELTLDVWIDGQDRVRRQRIRGFGRHGELDLTATFRGYGKPVSVARPPAGDTVVVPAPAAPKARG
ncbi:hypothetical protein [Streptomyces sp. NK08204]|uniref:hypothetical protein n=1 Tax=Streptomyces sp. NK08204 TaxID=2873260 RepID=UPI001CEDFEB5|nr:hypothetical protein [Streptomyces sp. NK08204]